MPTPDYPVSLVLGQYNAWVEAFADGRWCTFDTTQFEARGG